MAIVNTLLSWIIQQRMPQIEFFLRNPCEIQENWLKNLLYLSRDTEWGRRFDYKTITSSAAYRQRVPIQHYETLKKDIARMMQGEQNILWPGEIVWFAKSSGTTSDKSKFIPVSEESLKDCHFRGGKDMLSLYFQNHPNSQIFTGKSLVLGGSHQVNPLNPDSFYGDLSAVLIQNLPKWVEFYRVPERSIALMDEWEEKLDQMAIATSAMNITNISGVPTWTLLLIKKVMQLCGTSSILEVWPNLEVYFHGAVCFTPYRDYFKALIPSPKMHYMETYNASEGFFGIQDQPNSEDLLLMLDYGIYYEFIPFEEIDREQPQTCTLDQVILGKNYAIVITTNAGLWRYVIGDTIRFTSLNPYRIRITGRTKHYINAFGEELIVDNAEKALAHACQSTGAIINDYTAAPVYIASDRSGKHEWLIEFEKEPIDLGVFTEILDKALQSLNSDYEAKRYKNIALKSPLVISASKGTFYNWLKTKGKLGGQHKIPRLANTRQYLDEIKSFALRADVSYRPA